MLYFPNRAVPVSPDSASVYSMTPSSTSIVRGPCGATVTVPLNLPSDFWVVTEPLGRILMRVAICLPLDISSSLTTNDTSVPGAGGRALYCPGRLPKWKKSVPSRSAHRMNPYRSLRNAMNPVSRALSSTSSTIFTRAARAFPELLLVAAVNVTLSPRIGSWALSSRSSPLNGSTKRSSASPPPPATSIRPPYPSSRHCMAPDSGLTTVPCRSSAAKVSSGSMVPGASSTTSKAVRLTFPSGPRSPSSLSRCLNATSVPAGTRSRSTSCGPSGRNGAPSASASTSLTWKKCFSPSGARWMNPQFCRVIRTTPCASTRGPAGTPRPWNPPRP